MKRRIFVGDIQGCRAELAELLRKVAFDPARDELHPCGDFVNRGPDSAGVLRLCRELGAGGVLGNHDLHALHAARGERTPSARDTLDDLLAAPDREELLAWLAARPFVRAWDDVVLVHAAIHPRWKDPALQLASSTANHESADTAFAVSARYCDAAGTRPKHDWPAPPAPFRPWYEFWQERAGEARTAVFGHWARAGLVQRVRVRGLDTGCVWGGKLTAWIAETDEIVQVNAQRAWSEHD